MKKNTGKPLSDNEKLEIIEAYKNNPSIRGVAMALKRDMGTVRKVILASGVPTLSNESVADSIIRRMEKNPEMFSKNFEQLCSVLGSSNVVGVLRNQDKYREAVVDQARTALLLGLSALITGDKLNQASPSAIAQVVPVLAEIASGKYNLGKMGKEEISPDKIIDSIYLCLKRVKTFNPTLSKDAEDRVEGILNIPKSAYKTLSKSNGGNGGHPDTVQNRQ